MPPRSSVRAANRGRSPENGHARENPSCRSVRPPPLSTYIPGHAANPLRSHRPTRRRRAGCRCPKIVRFLPPISGRLIRTRSLRPDSAKTYEIPARGTACRKTHEFTGQGRTYRWFVGMSPKRFEITGKRRRPRPTRVCSARPPPDIASPSEGFGSGGLEIKPRSPDWHDTPSHPKRVRAGRFECLSNDLNGLSSTSRPGVTLISGI
jgi:hypothetical protein